MFTKKLLVHTQYSNYTFGGLDKLWSETKSGEKLSNGAKIGEWLVSGEESCSDKAGFFTKTHRNVSFMIIVGQQGCVVIYLCQIFYNYIYLNRK
jgi:hypothetical protein